MAVLDPSWLIGGSLEATATKSCPGPVPTAGCQSHARQQCGAIPNEEQLEHQETDIDRLKCGGVHF